MIPHCDSGTDLYHRVLASLASACSPLAQQPKSFSFSQRSSEKSDFHPLASSGKLFWSCAPQLPPQGPNCPCCLIEFVEDESGADCCRGLTVIKKGKRPKHPEHGTAHSADEVCHRHNASMITRKTVTYTTHELYTKVILTLVLVLIENTVESVLKQSTQSLNLWPWASVWIAHFLYCCALYNFFFWGFDFVSGNLATKGL